MAGVVEEVRGPESNGIVVGDRVCALLAGGGYAEYCAIPARMAMKVPSSMSFEEAAALPEAWLTAFLALNRYAWRMSAPPPSEY
jgi:tumor protein p53-inducible protein 3